MFVVLMLVQWPIVDGDPSFKKTFGQNENRTDRRSASKITDVRTPSVLSVKDRHSRLFKQRESLVIYYM